MLKNIIKKHLYGKIERNEFILDLQKSNINDTDIQALLFYMFLETN